MSLDGRMVRGVSGELYAHVFENETTGLERGLYWALVLNCRPIPIEGEEWDAAFLVDWLTWPVRRWPELDGLNLADATSPGRAEASFYLEEHYPARLEELSLRRATGATFRVAAGATFDLTGWGEMDGEGIRIDLEGDLEFRGVHVVPGNLTPPPESADEATAVVRRFLDPGDLHAPVLEEGFRYRLTPR